MTDSKPTMNFWQPIALAVTLLLSFIGGIGGYFKLSSDVADIKDRYVSRDQLAAAVATVNGDSGVKEEEIKDLTQQIVLLREELERLNTALLKQEAGRR